MQDIDISILDSLLETARIELSEQEKLELLPDLEKVIDYAHLLDQLDLEGVDPCYNVIPDIVNIMREDVVENTLTPEDLLHNAPSQISGMIKVPTVVEE